MRELVPPRLQWLWCRMVRPLPQPALETERLRLRPFSLSDASTVQALAGAREIAATTLNVPHPYEDGMAETWIQTHAQGYEADEQATFALTLKQTAELVGAIGLVISRAHARAELGYWVGLPFWNRGYATEAARAVLRFGFEALELNRIYAQHLVRNPASGRVMQKVGMRHEARLRHHIQKWGRFEDIDLYGILVEEWRQLNTASRDEP
jgi:ribosomal-protein-alanine N-acetyltransferase